MLQIEFMTPEFFFLLILLHQILFQFLQFLLWTMQDFLLLTKLVLVELLRLHFHKCRQ